MSKSLLNFLNHSKHCDLPRACSVSFVSFDKHSMRFCSSFLQMVTENQCCPQIVVSRHKIQLLQTILLYETCIVVSWKSLSDVRTKKWRQWRRLTELHWQLWPSIGKFQFHIYLILYIIILYIIYILYIYSIHIIRVIYIIHYTCYIHIKYYTYNRNVFYLHR